MPPILRRPLTVALAGFLLMAEAVHLVVSGMWALNMAAPGAQLSDLVLPVVVAPVVLAIVGKLVLSGFQVGRFAYWIVVGTGIWAVSQGWGNWITWIELALDVAFGIPLFLPKANAFFGGRDFRRIGVVETELPTPEEETRYKSSPRISPRGSGPTGS